MCTLAIFRDRWPRFPLVVAANRDEFLARPAAAPARWPEDPAVVAGRDLEASGTWLGCRVDGPILVAGLLNRRPVDGSARSSTGERSRGLLCFEALTASCVDDACTAVAADDLGRYGPFNLLLADRRRAVVLDNGAGTRSCELERGLSVLTNLDVNDPRCPRLASAVAGFERASTALGDDPSLAAMVDALRRVLSDHRNTVDPANTDPLARLCIHGDVYGTRSSSLIVSTDEGSVHYFHAAGRPCDHELVEVRY